MGGHHLEYIHHIYEAASVDQCNKYTFLLPQSFLGKKDKFDWIPLSNVVFDFFEDSLFEEDPSTVSQMLLNSYKICKFLGNYSKQKDIKVIYSNHMIVFVPFAPFFFRGTKIIGIIYRIFLHELNDLSWKQKIYDRFKYYIMSSFGVYKHILLLNDKKSPNQLNKRYHTDKFSYIPDPYLPLRQNDYIDIRGLYGIKKSQTLFVHFGAMNTNKGTLEIMNSLTRLSQEETETYSFIFAGKIAEDIKDSFYALYSKVKENLHIIIIDKYCSYDFFASLCISCDAIITPYKRTSQSSGLIGYASQFGKPVIAPNKGLLGNLVKEYNLGILIKDCTPLSLISAYKSVAEGNCPRPNRKYCEDNSVDEFNKYILEYLND